MDHSKMDHSKMDHSKMDHSKMDHSKEWIIVRWIIATWIMLVEWILSMHMGIQTKVLASLVLTIPLFFYPYDGVNYLFQFTFPGSDWLVMILATILFF